MRKPAILLVFLLLSLSLNGFAQKASSAAGGIFIDVGKDIPKKLTYKISRRTRGAAWVEIKTLHFDQDSSVFHADLRQAASHYPVFTLPEGKIKDNIWKMVAAAATIDSVQYYGYSPAYREALKTAYYDDQAKPDVAYEYQISTYLEKGARAISETIVKGQYPIVTKKDFLLKTMHIEPFSNRMVLRYYSDSRQEPSGVILLRSTYMQTAFEPVAGVTGMVKENDSTLYMAVDSNIREGSVYQYVAIPYDELGNEGLPSDTIRFAHAPYNNSAAVMDFTTTSMENESAIQLKWKLDKTPNVHAVNIYRSETYDNKKYDLIGTANVTDSVFLDRKVHPVKNYFYVLEPVNQFGRSFPSARVVGMLKANKMAMRVTSLNAEALEGKVRLKWTRPEFYTRGYYVYRSNGTDSLKQVTDLIVTDSLNVSFDDLIPATDRTKVFTYAVKAVNTSYDVSGLSERINVISQNKQMLTTPVNVLAKSIDGKTMIVWNNRSDENYIGFNVYRRKQENGATFEKLNPEEISSAYNYFEDKTILANQSYEYAIEAVGNNGQLSNKSNPVSLNIEEKQLLTVFNLSANTGKSEVLISWNKSNQEGVIAYKVYKINGEQKMLLATVKKDENSFEDKKPDLSELNTYAVTCVSSTTESILSTPVSVRLN